MTRLPATLPATRLPTAGEHADYARDGVVVVRGLVPPAVLDAAERGMARFHAGDHDAPFPGRTRFDHCDWSPSDGDVLRKNDYASRMVRELAALVEWPGIGVFAAALAGAGGVRLWHDQLLYKPPGPDERGNVGWHTDRQYWQGCSSTEMLTCWVPFHDCDAATGGVAFVPGSHRGPDPEGLDFFDQHLDARAAVVPELRRGDVTFHHCRTIHGSGPNTSPAPRRSMAIHLQPADNHHVPGSYHRNDELVRRTNGEPDYADPQLCPPVG